MSHWLRAFVVGLVAGLAGAPAAAEDHDRWVGPYIGFSLGYSFADVDGGLAVFQPNSNVPYATGPLSYSVDPGGPFAGLQLGVNGRRGPLFLGLELDIQAADITATSSTDFAPPSVFAFNYRATTSIDRFATLRARLGIASDDTLLYLTGGLAVGHVTYDAKYLITSGAPGGFADLKSESTQVGYALGAGIEHALSRSWSLKLEYQFINLGDQHAEGGLHFANGIPSNEKVTSDFSTELHTVRLGLNFHLQ
jgi:outer membrane immunogenic protein